MLKKNTNYFIAVDSETGTYFQGYQKLQTQEQIDAAINYGINTREIISMYSNLGQTLIKCYLSNCLRTIGYCFGIRYFRYQP
jgi:hypothetical protein